MRARAPLGLADWFIHLQGCADPGQLYVFDNQDGTPGAVCGACGRNVALRGSGPHRAEAERALRLEAQVRRAPAVAARFVVHCVDCEATIRVQRGDRPVVPLCAWDRARREAAKAERLRLRREANARDEARR